MTTRRRDNSRSFLFAIGIGLTLLTLAVRAGTEHRTPVEMLASTYSSGATLTPSEAREAIDRLTLALDGCHNDDVAFRILYRTGVIYFKAGMMRRSTSVFKRVADSSDSPALITACSLNMLGQIARLEGDPAAALDAFGRLADLCERPATVGPGDAPTLALRTLWGSALISRAEIYELQKDDTASGAEYERARRALEHDPGSKVLREVTPLVMDRLSQLHLRQRHVDTYMALTATLVEDYPAYHRTPMVALERTCTELLRDADALFECSNGALCAAPHLIAYLRQCKTDAEVTKALNAAETLCREYESRPERLFLDYHYAWMLDAVGMRDKAIDAMARAASNHDVDITGAKSHGLVQCHGSIMRDYAMVQQAIMLTEKTAYEEALRLMAKLPRDPQSKPHVSQLADSVMKSIGTLKREAPRNEAR